MVIDQQLMKQLMKAVFVCNNFNPLHYLVLHDERVCLVSLRDRADF